MDGQQQHHRYEVVITIGPTTAPVDHIFEWTLLVLANVHERPPGPVKVRVREPEARQLDAA